MGGSASNILPWLFCIYMCKYRKFIWSWLYLALIWAVPRGMKHLYFCFGFVFSSMPLLTHNLFTFSRNVSTHPPMLYLCSPHWVFVVLPCYSHVSPIGLPRFTYHFPLPNMSSIFWFSLFPPPPPTGWPCSYLTRFVIYPSIWEICCGFLC